MNQNRRSYFKLSIYSLPCERKHHEQRKCQECVNDRIELCMCCLGNGYSFVYPSSSSSACRLSAFAFHSKRSGRRNKTNHRNLLIVSLLKMFNQKNLEIFRLIYLNLFEKFICKRDSFESHRHNRNIDETRYYLRQ